MSIGSWVLSLPWSELTVNLAATGIWMTSAIVMSFLWFNLITCRRERQWVNKHALMLLVYFRNVDWRCEKIRNLVLNRKVSTSVELHSLRIELFKLQADLEAFNHLTAMWANRIDDFVIWRPYSEQVRPLLEAQIELHVALLRHVSPLLSITGEFPALAGSSHEGAQEKLLKDTGMAHYLAYFTGGQDRLWAGGQPDAGQALRPCPDDLLSGERKKGLSYRLNEVFHHLKKVLGDVGQLEFDTLWIWNPSEKAEDIWFGSKA